MSRPNIKHGVVVGNAAAINVELGWVPHSVDLYNATDGTLITTGFLVPYIMNFTGGGIAGSSPPVEIVVGSTLRGVTSKATGVVSGITLYSGSWQAGDAAGFLTIAEDSYIGTFTAGGEDVVITNPPSNVITTAAGGDATVPSGGVVGAHNAAISTQVASATGTSAISRYAGVAATASKGFTIGAALAVEAKVLRYRAFRGDVV